MNDALVDRISGTLGMLLASAYVLYTRGIEDSMLADPVGAAGVPTGVGVILFLASLVLFVKSWRAPKSQPVLTDALAGDAPGGSAHPHALAAGLLAMLAAYVALLPVLGYVLSIGLLVGGVAWFGGARRARSLALSMLLAGPVLWSLFDWMLEIRMPVGLWPQWLGS
jgi:putative tricarboxylic transport membrane protein